MKAAIGLPLVAVASAGLAQVPQAWDAVASGVLAEVLRLEPAPPQLFQSPLPVEDASTFLLLEEDPAPPQLFQSPLEVGSDFLLEVVLEAPPQLFQSPLPVDDVDDFLVVLEVLVVVEVFPLPSPLPQLFQSPFPSVPVAVVEQEVEVLVQTGTEMVHGQSVTVRVVEAETVYDLPLWTMTVADGT